MSACCLIETRIQFNSLKHHLGYLAGCLEKGPVPDLISGFAALCNNNIDLYTGDLAENQIKSQVIICLREAGIADQEAFFSWVGQGQHFRLIVLLDQSVWVVTKGDSDDSFIHIHPARTGPHTVRFKGSTLKTVYQLMLIYPGLQTLPTVEMVNQARLAAGLPPVKKTVSSQGILRCWELMRS